MSEVKFDALDLRGAELARAILDILEEDPDLHSQEVWGVRNFCGTTMCIAGHAAYLTGKAEFVDNISLNITDSDFEGKDFCELGAHLFGLDEDTAEQLFFEYNNKRALAGLKQIADGAKVIDWDKIDREEQAGML